MSITAPTRTPELVPVYRRRRIALATAWTVAIGAGVSLPWLTDGYTVSLATNALILAVVAVSTHLLGVAGLPSFGQTAYFGVGAYTTALLAGEGITNGGVHLMIGALVGAVAAALTGPLVLRTRGGVFLMVTFAIGQLVVVATSKTHVLGNDEGLSAPATTLPGVGAMTLDGYLYLYALAVICPLLAAIGMLLRSRLGLRWQAVADHEPRMAALGYRPTSDLMAAHVIAGALAGVGGALLVAAHRFVTPADLGMDYASCALLACAIGASTLSGTIVAALGIIAVRDLIGGNTSGHGTALLGVTFLVVAYTHILRRSRSNRAAARVNRGVTRTDGNTTHTNRAATNTIGGPHQ